MQREAASKISISWYSPSRLLVVGSNCFFVLRENQFQVCLTDLQRKPRSRYVQKDRTFQLEGDKDVMDAHGAPFILGHIQMSDKKRLVSVS